MLSQTRLEIVSMFVASVTTQGQAPLMSLSDVCTADSVAIHPYMHYVAAKRTAAVSRGMLLSLHTEKL